MASRKGKNTERAQPGLLDPPGKDLVPNRRDAKGYPSDIGTVAGVQSVQDYGGPPMTRGWDWRNDTRTKSPSRARFVAERP